jgi:catechol 2,3-dioxygenase-like lactoylglutathione lyase family enzyme
MSGVGKVFSTETLEKFEAASASIPLRPLERAFAAADIRLGRDPGGPEGSRRTQFRRYVASIDQHDPKELNQLGDALGALIAEVATSKVEYLVKAAESDGFVFADGAFRPARPAPRSRAKGRAELDLTHLNLDVRDLAASKHFYGDLLGLPATHRDGTLRIEHPSYLLVLNAGEPKVGGRFHFGFRVAGADGVDAWIEHLRANRVPVLVDPKRAGSVYVARIADPDGYEIEIYADL